MGTVYEAESPCVLDIGIARASDPDPNLPTIQTQAHQIIEMLPYMSPDQLSGTPEAVDKRNAASALAELLAARRKILGNANPKTLQTMCSLAWTRSGLRRHDEVDVALREAHEIFVRTFGDDHDKTRRGRMGGGGGE